MIEALLLSEALSQSEFSKKLEISKSHLSDIENGRKMVSPARAARFSKILGYSEKLFIQRVLQDQLLRDRFNYRVFVKEAA